MQWANGLIINGREVGNAVQASCDARSCSELIDRGLGYLCGDQHGNTTVWGCGRYFCAAHGPQTETKGEYGARRGHPCPGINRMCRGHEYEAAEPSEERPNECIHQDNQFSVCGFSPADHEYTGTPEGDD